MPTFDIEPHKGVGPVKLGMNRQQVRAVISAFSNNGLDHASRQTLDYAFGNSLQMEYAPEGCVQFIGVSYYNDCGCDYAFYGRYVGEYPALELFELLKSLDGEASHKFNASEYYFPNVKMTVWDADSQYDYFHGESRPVYGQVGVANHHYEST